MVKLKKISIIVPVYNGSARIMPKLEDLKKLNYPASQLEIIFISDGSTDGSNEILNEIKDDNVTVKILEKNGGKSNAQNEAVKIASNDFILFTDIDSTLDKNFINKALPYFLLDNTGCVGGDAVLLSSTGEISESQGFYWKFERVLRNSETKLGMLFSLPGWAFMVKKENYRELDLDTGDDMILPLDLMIEGKINYIAKDAFVYDQMPSSSKGELKARSRITLRNLLGVSRRSRILNPLKYGKRSLAVWFHKIHRWFTSVYLIVILLLSLAGTLAGSLFLSLFFFLQAAVYLVCFLNFFLLKRNLKIPILATLTSFLYGTLGFLIGIIWFLRRKSISSYKNAS